MTVMFCEFRRILILNALKETKTEKRTTNIRIGLRHEKLGKRLLQFERFIDREIKKDSETRFLVAFQHELIKLWRRSRKALKYDRPNYSVWHLMTMSITGLFTINYTIQRYAYGKQSITVSFKGIIVFFKRQWFCWKHGFYIFLSLLKTYILHRC